MFEGVPVAVAANREEFYARPWSPPSIQEGRPRVLCGIDETAGGTWLGVNEYGLFVAVTNRPLIDAPKSPRSRGLLCRELLECESAAAAEELAEAGLASGQYAGANFLCADAASGWIVEYGDDGAETPRATKLDAGLHLLANGAANDSGDMRQAYFRELMEAAAPSSMQEFAAASRRILATPLDESGERTIVVRMEERGTVSSSVVGVGEDRAASFFYFAPAAPDQTKYEDLSGTMQEMLDGE